MKTQILITRGYKIALLVSFLASCPIYAITYDNNLIALVPNSLQDTKQTVKLTGTVKDALGALSGVIITTNSNKVVTTDLNGKYTIDIIAGEVINFSMIGYKQQVIVYTSNHGSILNITLLEDSSTLDEIVVNAGYYSVKDRERTGSIARVTAKDIEFQPVVNPLQAIQGRVAGVDITENSGTPGGAIDIEIRGRNFLGDKFSGRNNPLYIIDGVPFLSNSLGIGGIGTEILQSGISPLNAINPSNIESIEILKDADATAIYGSRGANGVVLITTKKGKVDHARFTVSSSIGFSAVAKFMDMMDLQQYLQMRKEAFANAGITTYPINAYDINGTWDKNRYTNWQKELIGKTATNQNIGLDITGGSQQTDFNINLSHNENTTVFPTDKGYKRDNIRLMLNHRSKDDKLKINTSTTYATQSNNLPTMDLTRKSFQLAPNAPSLYDKEGHLNWENGTFENPLSQTIANYENKINTLILNLNLSYKVLPNTYFVLNTGLTNNNIEERRISPHTANNPKFELTSEVSESAKSDNKSNSYIIEPQLNYKNSWGNHSFDILIGSTLQNNESDSQRILGRNFTTDVLIRNISAAKEKYIGSSSKTQYKYVALFTRLNYQYNNKYILNLTARRDGSSRFAQDNRFGNFGAIGGAWLFSEENFVKQLSWLSFGKLRTSYGVTGSDNIGDYAYLDNYTIAPNAYNNEIGLYPSMLYNPNYKWEKTTKFETALELSFFQNKLNTTIAYYNNRSTDQLVGMTLPTTTGFTNINKNSPAIVENTGWEFTFNSQIIRTKDWNWTVNFNLSIPKNKLVSYPGLEEGTQSSFYIIGKPLNIVKLYDYKGLNKETSLFEFTDFNGDGKIDIQDQKAIANLNPSFYGGLQNSISYKNFTLDFLFYFKKQDNYNSNSLYIPAGSGISNQPVEMINRISTDNPNGVYMPASYRDVDARAASGLFASSNATISEASFIRLKNLSLSYVLQIPKVKIDSLRIYLQGQNLWTITSYKGMDPEFTSYGSLPPLRTYSFGMQLTF